MSIGALLRGAENWLRAEEQFDDQPDEAVGKRFGVHPAPGRPPPNFGQWYVALHWGGGRGNDPGPQRRDEFHGLVATLTARLNNIPGDRRGARFTTAAELYALVDDLVDAVHGSWGLVAAANEVIEGTAAYVAAAGSGTATVNGFVETLVLDADGPERPAPGGWLGDGVETKDVYVVDVRFRQARRIRPL
jgi:hypothetical protein